MRLLKIIICLTVALNSLGINASTSKDLNLVEGSNDIIVDFSNNPVFLNNLIRNPIDFFNNEFNIKDYAEIKDTRRKYRFLIKSNKGNAIAVFDNQNKLLSASLNFSSIVPTREVIYKVFTDNPGWTIKELKFKAKGHTKENFKRIYKYKLEKDGKTKKVTYKV